MTDSSTDGIKAVLHPVSDLDAAKTVYSALLGAAPTADSPYYVGFDVAGEHVDAAGHGRVTGHRAEQPRLAAQDRDVGRAVPTDRKGHRHI